MLTHRDHSAVENWDDRDPLLKILKTATKQILPLIRTTEHTAVGNYPNPKRVQDICELSLL